MFKKISTNAARQIRFGIEECREDIRMLGKPEIKAFTFSGATGLEIDGYMHTASRFYVDQLKRALLNIFIGKPIEPVTCTIDNPCDECRKAWGL